MQTTTASRKSLCFALLHSQQNDDIIINDYDIAMDVRSVGQSDSAKALNVFLKWLKIHFLNAHCKRDRLVAMVWHGSSQIGLNPWTQGDWPESSEIGLSIEPDEIHLCLVTFAWIQSDWPESGQIGLNPVRLAWIQWDLPGLCFVLKWKGDWCWQASVLAWHANIGLVLIPLPRDGGTR